MDDIRYTTPEEQVKKLKKQNLIISDDKYAEEMLQLCGYSNLIKSYRAPYFITVGGRKIVSVRGYFRADSFFVYF